MKVLKKGCVRKLCQVEEPSGRMHKSRGRGLQEEEEEEERSCHQQEQFRRGCSAILSINSSQIVRTQKNHIFVKNRPILI